MGSIDLVPLILGSFVTTAGGAVIGAISTAGWRARLLWGIALVFVIASFAYWRAADTHEPMVGFDIVWGSLPTVAVLLSLLLVTGREPRKPLPLPTDAGQSADTSPPSDIAVPIPENPALTPEYLNDLIAGTTELEAKNRIKSLVPQRARMKGQVKDVALTWDGAPRVHVAGLVKKYGYWWTDIPAQDFRKGEEISLAAIKPADWIEFVGTVTESSQWGWVLTDCVFVARAESPEPPKPRRAPRSRKLPKD
jgi:hypothetical protein